MNKLVLLAPALMTTLFTTTALAAGGGGGHHGAPHVANWWTLTGRPDAPALGWLSITFVIFVAGLIVLLRKPINKYLASRSDEVKLALEEAKEAKAKAEARAREYQERVAKLDDEIAALKNDFRTRGENEMKRLEESGEKSAARLLKDAKDTIAAESERAQSALKTEASRLAIELAEKRIQERLKTSDHKHLTTSFLSDLAN